MRFPLSLSIAEPEDLEMDHFPECATSEDGHCNCDSIERDLRADFAALTRECY